MGFYMIEQTDTFGGEANYCWANRGYVRAIDGESDAATIRRLKASIGLTGAEYRRAYGNPDDSRYNAVGAHRCFFTQYLDELPEGAELYEPEPQAPRGRKYKTRAGAERRAAALRALFPGRRFWAAPTQDFRFAVYTDGAICA